MTQLPRYPKHQADHWAYMCAAARMATLLKREHIQPEDALLAVVKAGRELSELRKAA